MATDSKTSKNKTKDQKTQDDETKEDQQDGGDDETQEGEGDSKSKAEKAFRKLIASKRGGK